MNLTSMNQSVSNFIKKYTQFLREDSLYSTMRMATTIMIVTICFYVAYQTFLKLPIDWWGASGFATVALGGKMLQKKDEVKGEIVVDKINGNLASKKMEINDPANDPA